MSQKAVSSSCGGVWLLEDPCDTCLQVLPIQMWLRRKMGREVVAHRGGMTNSGSHSWWGQPWQGTGTAAVFSTPNQPLEHSGTSWQWLSQKSGLPPSVSRNVVSSLGGPERGQQWVGTRRSSLYFETSAVHVDDNLGCPPCWEGPPSSLLAQRAAPHLSAGPSGSPAGHSRQPHGAAASPPCWVLQDSSHP